MNNQKEFFCNNCGQHKPIDQCSKIKVNRKQCKSCAEKAAEITRLSKTKAQATRTKRNYQNANQRYKAGTMWIPECNKRN